MISNQRFSQTEIFDELSGNVEFKFDIEKEGNFNLKVTMNTWEDERIGVAEGSFTFQVPKADMNKGINTVDVLVDDVSVWSYDLIWEDRDTFTLARRLEHSLQPTAGGRGKFVAGEGYTLNRNEGELGTISGNILQAIPTKGKSKISQVAVDSITEDEVMPEDIELPMTFSRTLDDDFKEYKRTIKKSDFNNINSIDIV